MNLILSFAVGTIIYLGFGYIVFELLIGKYMKENTLSLKGFNKSDKDSSLLFLILSCAAYSALLTFIIYNWARTLRLAKGS